VLKRTYFMAVTNGMFCLGAYEIINAKCY